MRPCFGGINSKRTGGVRSRAPADGPGSGTAGTGSQHWNRYGGKEIHP